MNAAQAEAQAGGRYSVITESMLRLLVRGIRISLRLQYHHA